jgi:hypothetical protein
MKTENKVFLRVHEFDCPIEDISNELGIKPTKSWLKDELIPNREGDIRRKQSTWEYQSQLNPLDSVEKHIVAILKLFELKKEKLIKYSQEYETEMSIVIYEYESPNVGFSLEKQMIQKISSFGLVLDVDVYVLLE